MRHHKEEGHEADEPSAQDDEGKAESEEAQLADEPSSASVTLSRKEYDAMVQEVNEGNEFKAKYWQLLAERENLRKRLMKEKDEHGEHVAHRTLNTFLAPIDQMELALFHAAAGSPELKNWAVGFQMILNQFKEAIASHNVEPIEVRPGDSFDPHYHEAGEVVTTDEHAPGTILEQKRRGYRAKSSGRTLRPAVVVVSKAHPKASESTSEGDDDEQNEQEEQ